MRTISDMKKMKGLVWMADPKVLQVFPEDEHRRSKRWIDPRSYQDDDGVWHVKALAHSQHSVFMICPICGRIHGHGYGDGDYAGYRVPHCHDNDIACYHVE